MVHAEQRLRVGLYESPPKVFSNAAGEADGILIQILRQIAREEDWTLEFEPCEWQSCLDQLEAGTLDLMPDVAYTEQRAQRFAFHQIPVLHSWSQLYRREDIQIDSILDLTGKRIGVLSSGVQSELLAQMLSSFGIQAELHTVRSMEDAFREAAAGKFDVVAVNQLFGNQKAAQYRLKATPVMFQPAKLFYATPAGRHAEVRAAIDRHLERWIKDEDSPYYRILHQWGAPSSKAPLSRTLLFALIGVSLIGVALGRAVWWLRRRVAQTVGELRASNNQLSATLRAIPDLLFEMSADGRYIAIHTSREELLAAPREQLKGKRVEEVLPAEAARAIHTVLEATLRDGHHHGQLIELVIDAQSRWFELSAARKDNQPGEAASVIVLSRDVTERIQAQQRIQQMAESDQLTGLPNRGVLPQLFQQTVALSQRHGQPVAVLFMDLDHFKRINDALGHVSGDSLLVQTARRIQHCLRHSDLVCRMGGDEFVLVLPETDAIGAAQLAGRLHDAIQPAFVLNEQRISITASIGIAMYPDDGSDIDTLLRKSDAAMYQAKAEGRNGFRFFTDEMQARSNRLLALSNALATALAHQEITLHYQPIVRVGDRAVVGAEALLRWIHPVLGQVSPAEFIPVAESSGQIIRLGDWVLEQAVIQASRWHAAGHRLKMAVNISSIQFRHPDFVSRVAKVLATHGLPAACLELEVTESLTMGDPEAAIRIMQALRALGVGLAIDDFGTGYSSMSYLRRLGFDKLKVDQSFVRDIGRDPEDEAIVSAIIQLGHSLGVTTLAEGVETEAQQAFLASRGCELMQGWLIGRAVPADEFARFLKSSSGADNSAI